MQDICLDTKVGTCMYLYLCVWIWMCITMNHWKKIEDPPPSFRYLSPFLVCSCDKELKGISMLTQTEQDTSLQHPASLSQPAVLRPQGSRDNIIETLTGPNSCQLAIIWNVQDGICWKGIPDTQNRRQVLLPSTGLVTRDTDNLSTALSTPCDSPA